ncbi:hypothetical protein DMB37_31740 [Nocardia sp. CS682]|nr:hypothetical protein DMB37_31740 [Nocardia sp. CS682]
MEMLCADRAVLARFMIDRINWARTPEGPMYVEEFRIAGPLTAESAEELLAGMIGYTSRIIVSSNGRSVHAPLLPSCWDVLRLRAGSTVTVTAEHGHRPELDEDRQAIRVFVDRFQELTSA